MKMKTMFKRTTLLIFAMLVIALGSTFSCLTISPSTCYVFISVSE